MNPKPVTCPECHGLGEEFLLTHYALCGVCGGDGVVSHATMVLWELSQGRKDTDRELQAVRSDKKE